MKQTDLEKLLADMSLKEKVDQMQIGRASCRERV